MSTTLTSAIPQGQGTTQRAPAIPAPYLIAGKPLASLINYSKANPTTSIANLAKQYISSGAYDSQALKEGTDLSFAGRPALADMQEAAKNPIQKASDAIGGIAEKIQGGITDIGQEAGDKTVEQQQQGGEKMLSSVEEGAQKEGQASENNDVPGEVADNLETMLGTASGAVQTIFAPITGIVQAITDKVSDSKAVQDFADGNKTAGGILDLYDQLGQKVNEIAAAHPEEAKNFGDAVNVLLSTLGGETEAGEGALNADVGESGGAVKKAVTDLGGPDGPGGAAAAAIAKTKEAIGNAAENMSEGVGEGVSKVKEGTDKITSKVAPAAVSGAKNLYSQVYGLPSDDIDFLLKNPQYATPEALSSASLHNLGTEVESNIGKTRGSVPSPSDLTEEVRQGLLTKAQQLREHAMKYPTGSNSPLNTEKGIVKVDPDWLRTQLEDPEKAGIKLDQKGNVTHGDANSKINAVDSPGGARRLQDLWDTWGPEFAKGQMTRANFIRFRQSLASMANYGGGFDNVLNKAADSIRSKFNSDYREQIPGLEALDKEHTKMTRDFQNSMKGLATQDPVTGEIKMQDGAASTIMNGTKDTKGEVATRLEGITPGITKKVAAANKFISDWSSIVDDNGRLKEGSLLNIKNSLNAGRDLRLQKLESIMPGITDRLRLIKAADNFHGSLGFKPGKYISAAGVSQIFTGNPLIGLAAAMGTNPRVGLMILRKLGEMGK